MQAGSWKLIDRLGAGGMGEVWSAEGPSGRAAVKIVRGDAVDEAGPRFEREARALRALQHTNVVRALDFGRTDDGSLYLAMDLLEGESLEARIARAPLAPLEAL